MATSAETLLATIIASRRRVDHLVHRHLSLSQAIEVQTQGERNQAKDRMQWMVDVLNRETSVLRNSIGRQRKTSDHNKKTKLAEDVITAATASQDAQKVPLEETATRADDAFERQVLEELNEHPIGYSQPDTMSTPSPKADETSDISLPFAVDSTPHPEGTPTINERTSNDSSRGAQTSIEDLLNPPEYTSPETKTEESDNPSNVDLVQDEPILQSQSKPDQEPHNNHESSPSEDPVVETTPPPVLPDGPDALREVINQAKQLETTGHTVHAIMAYGDAIDLSPKDLGALVGRGRCLVATGDYTSALMDLQKAKSLAPLALEPNVGLGDLFYAQKEYGIAIEHYSATLRLDPSHALARVQRALCHHHCGDSNAAMQDILNVQRRHPGLPGLDLAVMRIQNASAPMV